MRSYPYSGSSYANPHAVTTINGVTYRYDRLGNLASTSAGLLNTWDYRNRLISSGTGSATSTYEYDADDERVKKTENGVLTRYFSDSYSTTGASTTKNIYANGELVAVIEVNGSASSTRYIHPDHLGSTNLATTDGLAVSAVLDYYPYGTERISSGNATSRHYIGEEYDSRTQQSYLNARYYNGAQGQFISEDPSHLAIGDPAQLKQFTGQDQQTYLMDPQQLNSYSYGRDNPITKSDPTGRAFGIDDAIGFVGGGAVAVFVQTSGSLISTGRFPSPGEAAGAFVTGGVIGWGTINTPETLGASNAVSASIVTGLLGGYYGNLTKQGIDIATGKQTGGVNYNELHGTALITAGTNGLFQGALPNAKIPGLSSGRNSMSAIGESMRTKTANGTISNMSANTALKSAIGSQSADLYRTAAGGAVDTARSPSDNKNR